MALEKSTELSYNRASRYKLAVSGVQMSIIRTYLTQCIAVMLLASLLACASAPKIHTGRSVNDYNNDPLNEGMLIASSVVNTGEIGQIQSIQLLRTNLAADATKKEYLITNQISGKSRDLSLFFGALPSGKYRIVQVNSGGKYVRYDTPSPWLGEFEIKAGQTSDLGMIVMTAANFKVLIGRSRKFTNSSELIQRFYADNATLSNRINGWTTPISETDYSEFFALKHVQGIGNLAELPSGEIVAGTRLGTLLIRDTQGKWRIAYRKDFYDAFTFVASLPIDHNADFMAISDNNESYVFESGVLKPFELGNLPNGKITFLDSDKSASNWYIAVNEDKKFNLYHSTKLENGDWKKVDSSDISFSSWSGQRNAWAIKSKTGLILGSSEKPVIRCLNYQTQQWTTSKIPNERTLTDLKTNIITGELSILTSPGGGFGGIFAKSYMSPACGSAWEQITSPYSVEVAAPIPLNSRDIAVLGGVFSDEGIYGSNDRGKNWKKLTDQSVLTHNFFITQRNGLVVIDKGNLGVESVRQSDDDGKTWDLELSSIDYSLLKANQERAAKKQSK